MHESDLLIVGACQNRLPKNVTKSSGGGLARKNSCLIHNKHCFLFVLLFFFLVFLTVKFLLDLAAFAAVWLVDYSGFCQCLYKIWVHVTFFRDLA